MEVQVRNSLSTCRGDGSDPGGTGDHPLFWTALPADPIQHQPTPPKVTPTTPTINGHGRSKPFLLMLRVTMGHLKEGENMGEPQVAPRAPLWYVQKTSAKPWQTMAFWSAASVSSECNTSSALCRSNSPREDLPPSYPRPKKTIMMEVYEHLMVPFPTNMAVFTCINGY